MKALIAGILSLSFIAMLGSTKFAEEDTSCYERATSPCDSVLGTTAIDTCIFFPLIPVVQVGDTVTKCFTFRYTSPFNIGYINVTGICGPIAPYNQLDFELYNYLCDSMIVSGQIYPSTGPTAWVNYLTPGETYIICFTWIALCEQTEVCPSMMGSLLPVQLVSFVGTPGPDCTTLTWVTATEINVSSFAVETTTDFNNWLEVDAVQAVGSSIVYQSYTIEDCGNQDYSNTRYYRLVEYDTKGGVSVLSTIAIGPNDNFVSDVEIYNSQGQRVSDFQIGLNIVRNGNRTYKVFKWSDAPGDITIGK